MSNISTTLVELKQSNQFWMPASQNTVKKTGEGGKRCDIAAPMKSEALTESNFYRVGEIILCVCEREYKWSRPTNGQHAKYIHTLCVCVYVSADISKSQPTKPSSLHQCCIVPAAMERP